MSSEYQDPEHIKKKIINFYLQKERIGFSGLSVIDFDIFNNNGEKDTFLKNINNDGTVSDGSFNKFKKIIDEIKNEPVLQNKFGLDFINELEKIKKNNILISSFFKETPNLSLKNNFNSANRKLIEHEAEIIAKKYGLKECYYIFDQNLNEQDNVQKALELFNNLEDELNKIQKYLKIKNSYNVGNGILAIALNYQDKENSLAHYNALNNQIVIKDNLSTMVHEYVHFVDKTISSLLLTKKTTQENFEGKNFTDEIILNNFNMDKIIKNFNWYKKLKFKDEVEDNKYIEEIFNKYESNINYKNKFKQILFNWIDKKQLDVNLKKDIEDIFLGKNIDGKNYSFLEDRIIGFTKIFHHKELSNNNFMHFSKLYDEYNAAKGKKNNLIIGDIVFEAEAQPNKDYYQSQREMLARTIDKIVNKNLTQLVDRLTSPDLNKKEKEKFIEILASWKNTTDEILAERQKIKISEKIKGMLNFFHKKEITNTNKNKI